MAHERTSRRSPDRPPTHPGAFLREIVLPASGHSKKEVAGLLHVSRQHLYAILDGKSGVTAGMALRLGKLFGNGARLWLNMQRAHDLWQAERELAGELASITPLPQAATADDAVDEPEETPPVKGAPATPPRRVRVATSSLFEIMPGSPRFASRAVAGSKRAAPPKWSSAKVAAAATSAKKAAAVGAKKSAAAKTSTRRTSRSKKTGSPARRPTKPGSKDRR